MLSMPQIVERLQDRRIERVSDATGLSVPTIRAIRDRTNVNPQYTTLKSLEDYFEAREGDYGIAAAVD